MLIDSFIWEFTSTGSGGFRNTPHADAITFYAETNATSTASVVFEEAPGAGSTSHSVALGASSGLAAISTGAVRTVSFTRPVGAVRPRVTDMSSGGVRVTMLGVGSW